MEQNVTQLDSNTYNRSPTVPFGSVGGKRAAVLMKEIVALIT